MVGMRNGQLSQWADKINFITRKLAHMTEYFALAVAVSFPLYVYGLHGFLLMLVAGIICVGFSCGDEYHPILRGGTVPRGEGCLHRQLRRFLGNHSRTNHRLDRQKDDPSVPGRKRRRPLLMSMSTNRNQPGRKLLQSRRRSFLAERRKTVGKNIMNPRRAMDPRAVMDPDRSSRYTGIPRHGGLPTIIMARRISTIPGMRKIRRMGIILKMETILRMETMSRRRGITTRKITMSHRMAITTLKTTTSPRMATTPGRLSPGRRL